MANLTVQNNTNNNDDQNSLLNEEQSENIKNKLCKLAGNTVFTVSQDKKQDWNENKKKLRQSRSENYYEKYVEDVNYNIEEFQQEILMDGVIYFCFSAVSVLCFIVYSGIQMEVCQKCCCKKKKDTDQLDKMKLIIDDIDKDSSQRKFLKICGRIWPFLGILVCALSGIGVSVMFLIDYESLQSAFNQFNCIGAVSMHGLNFGYQEFLGLNFFKSQVQKFVELDLDIIQQQSNEKFQGTPVWLEIEKDFWNSIKDEADGVCDVINGCNQCSKPVYPQESDRPQFFEIDGSLYRNGMACSGQNWEKYKVTDLEYDNNPNAPQSLEKVESVYFRDVLPQSLNNVQSKFGDSIQVMQDNINELEYVAQNINNQESTLKTDLQTSLVHMGNFEVYIQNKTMDIDQFHNKYESSVGLVNTSIIAIVIVVCILSGIITVVSILIYAMNYLTINKCMTFVWVNLAICMTITFGVSGIFDVMVSGGEQSCEILEASLNDPGLFERYTVRMEDQIRETFRVCKRELNLASGPYRGIDDFTQTFNIYDQFQAIKAMNNGLQGFILQNDGENAVQDQELKELEDQLQDVQNQLQFLITQQQYSNGQQEHKDLENAIGEFQTKLAASSCQDDLLVQKKSDCGSKQYSSFKDAGTSSTDYCFLVSDEYVKLGGLGRYSVCGAQVELQLENILKWRQELDRIAKLKQQQIDALQKQLKYVFGLYKKYVFDVFEYNFNVGRSIGFIGDEEEGLISQVTCFWFGEQLEQVYETFCTNFVNDVYNMSFYVKLISFLSFFGVFFIFVGSRKIKEEIEHDGIRKKIQAQNILASKNLKVDNSSMIQLQNSSMQNMDSQNELQNSSSLHTEQQELNNSNHNQQSVLQSQYQTVRKQSINLGDQNQQQQQQTIPQQTVLSQNVSSSNNSNINGSNQKSPKKRRRTRFSSNRKSNIMQQFEIKNQNTNTNNSNNNSNNSDQDNTSFINNNNKKKETEFMDLRNEIKQLKLSDSNDMEKQQNSNHKKEEEIQVIQE